jgi:hypothetical protein
LFGFFFGMITVLTAAVVLLTSFSRSILKIAGAIASVKQQGPPGSAPGRPFVADARTIVVVLWVWWTACTLRAVPHVASRERCAVPHVVHDDQCVALLVVHDDRRAALDHVSYWALLERLVLQRLVLGRLVMAGREN